METSVVNLRPTLRQMPGVRCQPRSAPISVPKTKAIRMAVSIRPNDQGSAAQTSESTFWRKGRERVAVC